MAERWAATGVFCTYRIPVIPTPKGLLGRLKLILKHAVLKDLFWNINRQYHKKKYVIATY